MKYKLEVGQDGVRQGLIEDQGRGITGDGVFDQDVTHARLLSVVETRVILVEEKKQSFDVIQSLFTMLAYGSRLKSNSL